MSKKKKGDTKSAEVRFLQPPLIFLLNRGTYFRAGPSSFEAIVF